MKPISVEKSRLKKGGEASSANEDGAGDSEDYRIDEDEDDNYQSEGSETPKNRKGKRNGQAKAAGKRGAAKDKKWEKAFTEDGTDVTEKPEKKKRNPPRKARENINPNMIKTSNKLIGEIENKDLYGDDDDVQIYADKNDTDFNLTG